MPGLLAGIRAWRAIFQWRIAAMCVDCRDIATGASSRAACQRLRVGGTQRFDRFDDC
jgi:hypothetical protein